MKKYWPLIIITLIGGFLRLYRIEPSLQFLGDQGRDALVMLKIFSEGHLPFIGPITSVGGFYLGPLYYYLMAPFLWLARFNPVGPAIATAIIGTLTIPALYFVAKKIFSQNVALWASLLYTFGFIPISGTRSAWNPNPMPLAALGIIYGFYTKRLWLVALSLGAALQFHYMIVFLGPWILWQVILARRQKKELWQSLVILLLLMSPLILFEIKNNWLNTRGLLEFLTKHEYGHLDWLQVVKDMNGRAEQAVGMVLGFGQYFNPLRTWLTRLWLIGLLIFIKQWKFLAPYVLISIAAIAVYQSNIYPHYLGFLFPAVFMLTAVILSRLTKFALPVFTLLFLFYNLPPTLTLINQNGNLANAAATAGFIKQDIELNLYQNVNLASIDDTHDYPAMNFRYFLTLSKTPLLAIDQYPQTQVLYVISPYPQTNLLEEPMWEIQSLLPAEVVQSWESTGRENVYKIERL